MERAERLWLLLMRLMQGDVTVTNVHDRALINGLIANNIIAEIGYILGHQWSDYSLRDLVALLTEETPAQFSSSANRALKPRPSVHAARTLVAGLVKTLASS